MPQRRAYVIAVSAVVGALCLPGCAASIPQEKVPDGWALNVHQPGEWWTQPLIPRSVIVQRCAPKPGWTSNPDLSRVTALPPGTDVEFSFFADDYHCDTGWSLPSSEVQIASGELATEKGWRRVCTGTGLPMDSGWRYLGHNPTQRTGVPSDTSPQPGVSTAAFIDEHGTVVGCTVGWDYGDLGAGVSVKLAVGADVAATAGNAACPVMPSNIGRDTDGTVADYELKGAGAVRDDAGRVLTKAASLRIGLIGDGATTSHPVVDGIAIVDANVTPTADIPFEDWDHAPAVEGRVFDKDGKLLASCRT